MSVNSCGYQHLISPNQRVLDYAYVKVSSHWIHHIMELHKEPILW